MGRLSRILAAGMTIGLALFAVPPWTAAREESHREIAFVQANLRPQGGDLPDCPAAGPERDSFLTEHQRVKREPGAAQLWVPVCHVVAPRLGKLIVVSTNRAELAFCRIRQTNPLMNIGCALEEPLRFLAEPTAKYTWARRQAKRPDGGGTIWVSATKLPWDDHLVSEHRKRMAYWLAALGPIALLSMGGGTRARLACASRAACHGAGEPDLPRGPEFLLHWILGANSYSLPGDLGQEYTEKLVAGWSRASADRWYRKQVFSSIGALLASQVARAFRPARSMRG